MPDHEGKPDPLFATKLFAWVFLGLSILAVAVYVFLILACPLTTTKPLPTEPTGPATPSAPD